MKPAFTIDLRPLARRRKLLNLSQRELGELVGMDDSSICRFERNVRPMPLSILVACARELGTPIWDLFEVHDVKEPR